VRALDVIRARHRSQDRESGQAIVEFALILIPLLLLVVGIIQFGIGLNYWLDMNRLANQGARWAVVNAWPDCPRTQAGTCSSATVGPGNSLETYLTSQAITDGLKNSVTVSVCYPPTGDPQVDPGTNGAPVQVSLTSPYNFRLIMKLPSITLRARATMRLEQDPTHIVASTC
jgi:Flp pilus assembly protein TadG